MKYCDYFPKSMLFKYQIEPNKKLEIDENKFFLNDRENNIIKSMKNIYSTFQNSTNKNSDTVKNDNLINRKIVAMFYDLDILKSDDIQKFPLDMKIQDKNESLNFEPKSQRESIVLEELDIKNQNKNIEKSKQVFVENRKEPLTKGTIKW